MKPSHEQSAASVNRSMPRSVVIPVLAYPNVREAVDWLCRSFGFVERLRIGDHRSQLSFGAGSVVVAGGAPASETINSHALPAGAPSHFIMVRVVDVDGHYEHAERMGARIVNPPTDYPYGERQYLVEDLGGHRWTFSETIADVDPSVWGGILFE